MLYVDLNFYSASLLWAFNKTIKSQLVKCSIQSSKTNFSTSLAHNFFWEMFGGILTENQNQNGKIKRTFFTPLSPLTAAL